MALVDGKACARSSSPARGAVGNRLALPVREGPCRSLMLCLVSVCWQMVKACPWCWPCLRFRLARGFDHCQARPPRAGLLSPVAWALVDVKARARPSSPARGAIGNRLALPDREGPCRSLMLCLVSVCMLADGEGLPVVLALFEVPACPWLRSPSSQPARPPREGLLSLGHMAFRSKDPPFMCG